MPTRLLPRLLVVLSLLLAAGPLAPRGVPPGGGGMEVGAAFPGKNGRIAFVSSRDGNFEIYTMQADGSNPINRTTDPAIDSSPAWSADREQIAFTSNRDGNFEIYTMQADGSSPTNRTKNAAPDFEPDWQPRP